MPGEKKADGTGGTQQGVGMFDNLGGAPEASKDAATVEPDENTEETTEDQTTTEETTQEQTEETETGSEEKTEPELDENGQPIQKQETQVQKEEPFEINGRTFASRDELATAYKNSSSEGLRLAKQHDEDVLQMDELRARLLELEDAQAKAPFPGLLSADPAQEEAQLEMLPQHKQTEYMLNKREWEQNQQKLKEATAQKRKELEINKTRIKEIIAKNDADMANRPAEFPMYKELKPTMDKIVELSPVLANRPETPYLSYWIARGLSLSSVEKTKTAEIKKAATVTKEKVAAAQSQIGKGGIGKSTTKAGSDGASPTVQAWRDRQGSVI